VIPIPALILKSAAMKLKTSYGEMLRKRIRVMMDLQHALCFYAVFQGLTITTSPETWQRAISVHSEEIRELMLWRRFHNLWYGFPISQGQHSLKSSSYAQRERGALITAFEKSAPCPGHVISHKRADTRVRPYCGFAWKNKVVGRPRAAEHKPGSLCGDKFCEGLPELTQGVFRNQEIQREQDGV